MSDDDIIEAVAKRLAKLHHGAHFDDLIGHEGQGVPLYRWMNYLDDAKETVKAFRAKTRH